MRCARWCSAAVRRQDKGSEGPLWSSPSYSDNSNILRIALRITGWRLCRWLYSTEAAQSIDQDRKPCGSVLVFWQQEQTAAGVWCYGAN